MIVTFDTRTVLLVGMLVFLSVSGPLDMVGGIILAIVGILQAILNAIESIPGAIAALFSSGRTVVSHEVPKVYSTTLNLVSDAKSYISNTFSHTFSFANPVQSVDVTLTLHNVGSMRLSQLSVNFHIAGKTISVPVANLLSGPDVTADSGPILLPTPLSVVGVTVDIAGTLCGSGCSNLTFTPSADLVASVPPEP